MKPGSKQENLTKPGNKQENITKTGRLFPVFVTGHYCVNSIKYRERPWHFLRLLFCLVLLDGFLWLWTYNSFEDSDTYHSVMESVSFETHTYCLLIILFSLTASFAGTNRVYYILIRCCFSKTSLKWHVLLDACLLLVFPWLSFFVSIVLFWFYILSEILLWYAGSCVYTLAILTLLFVCFTNLEILIWSYYGTAVFKGKWDDISKLDVSNTIRSL